MKYLLNIENIVEFKKALRVMCLMPSTQHTCLAFPRLTSSLKTTVILNLFLSFANLSFIAYTFLNSIFARF